MKRRLIALVHDGDCADCSYTPLEIPTDLDMQAAMTEYRQWWTSQRNPSDYVSLANYLVDRHGAKWPDIEEYDW